MCKLLREWKKDCHIYYFNVLYSVLIISKNLNIGAINLTHVNYGIINNEIKLIDSLKYYQKSLADLSSTRTKEENFHTISHRQLELFSELKLQAVDDVSYENSKFLYKSLQMRNLGDLNDLYNTQDVVLLCEILESRFQAMQNTYDFNPRKCNSASTMSSYIEREMSKVIITLPTKMKHVEIFEQTVIDGFSCVNNRLAFNTQILLPNFLDLEMNVKKDFNYKIAYNLKIDNQKAKKRIITKILKLDENNQYGHGMTKLLPTGCIKDNPNISWKTFNMLLESVSLEDKSSHLYIVDIEFGKKNATEKLLAYNEIYPPIIEKQKTIDPCERSIYQLLEQFFMGEKGPATYKKVIKCTRICLKKFFYQCI